jgi:hypothetical protein
MFWKDFRAGSITLGGNNPDGSKRSVSNYVVLIKPSSDAPPEPPPADTEPPTGQVVILKAAFIKDSTKVQVNLAWLPNPENQDKNIAGYKVYYKSGESGPPYDGTGSGKGDSPIVVALADLDDPSNLFYTITELDANKEYFFVVTVFDEAGNESGYSNEASGKTGPFKQLGG